MIMSKTENQVVLGEHLVYAIMFSCFSELDRFHVILAMETRLMFMAIPLLLQLIIQRFTLNVFPDYACTVRLKTKTFLS